jgi:hypothetical protein
MLTLRRRGSRPLSDTNNLRLAGQALEVASVGEPIFSRFPTFGSDRGRIVGKGTALTDSLNGGSKFTVGPVAEQRCD